ncbi:MAG: hypothetical protein KDC44_21065 [Phaeodactylibacter sp.]|nr:hypothetical protein [Phaeodactylibacter sp.]
MDSKHLVVVQLDDGIFLAAVQIIGRCFCKVHIDQQTNQRLFFHRPDPLIFAGCCRQ